MAQKIKPTEPRDERSKGASVGERDHSSSSWRWWLAFGLVACVLAGTGGLLLRRQLAAREALVLPAMPELKANQAELRQRLSDAHARASSGRGTRWEGVAELGRLYHASGFNQQAMVCWQLLLKARPGEARWSYYLADLRRMAADSEGLRSLLERTVQLAPDYAPAWLELAELEFKSGRLDAAEKAYRRRIELVVGDPYGRLGLVRLMLQRGQREEGKRQIETLVREAPDFPSAHNVYAEILAQEGDLQKSANQRWFGTVAGRFRAAADPWKEELRASCFDPDQLMIWGAIELQTKRGDRGQSLFERAIRLAPDNPRGYESLGAMYLEAGEAAKACETLEKGSQLPGASELLFVSLGNGYRMLRQPADALRVAERGLARMTDSADLANARGLALDELGRTDEALAAYRLAVARAPSAADPVANIGISLLRRGQREEAYSYLKKAVELQPMFPKAVTLLARLELDAGRMRSAAEFIFPYFEQYPGLRVSRDLMAKYYLRSAFEAAKSGDSAAAEKACKDGLAIVPEASELHGFLGSQYLQQRRLPEALQSLETSRRLQPDDARVSLYLGQAYAASGRFDEARRAFTEGQEQALKRGEAAVAAQCRELSGRLPQ